MKIFKIVLLTLITGCMLTSCEKEYSFESGDANLTSGTWQFQNNTRQYAGNLDSAVIKSFSSTKVLTLAGKSLNGQETFRVILYTTGSFTTTSYVASLSQCEFDYFTPSKTIFKGDFLTGEFVVSITALSNNTITGIFSGAAEDSTGAETQITLGAFTSTIDLSNNGGQGPQSVGTLGANPDTCSPIIVSGNFTTGTALSAANTIQVEVNVTAPGTFAIASNSVNGFNFIKTGVFTTTGLQNVVLNGSGMPQSQGVQYFTVTYGASNCLFSVTCLQGTVPTGDYLPTTINSNWAYGLTFLGATDSLLTQVIPYAPTIGGNVYVSFASELIPTSGSADDTGYFRKAGNDYFTYASLGDFFGFDAPVSGEYRFLNDALAAGSTFRSPDFNGTTLSLPATAYIQVTIDEKAVAATIGGRIFPDVIKATYQYYNSILPGVPFTTEERWYARGVGLIYDNIDVDDIVVEIGRYTVL